MDRVAAQEAGTFEEVIGGALAHDGGPEAELLTAAGLLDEEAGQKAADATETVEDDVLGLVEDGADPGVDAGQLPVHIGLGGQSAAFGGIVVGQLAQVDAGRSQVQLADGFQQGKGVHDRQLIVEDLPGEAVGLEDIDGRAVGQGAPIHRDHDVLVPVEAAEERQHLLSCGFLGLPFFEVVVLLGCVHGATLLNVRSNGEPCFAAITPFWPGEGGAAREGGPWIRSHLHGSVHAMGLALPQAS